MNYRRLYIPNSYIHIVIVTYNRIPILIDNIDVLREAFKNVKKYYSFELFAVCVLPDHIHMIIKPEIIEKYPKIISAIKHSFSKNVGQVCPTYDIAKGYINKREKGIFQRRYYEHTLKNEDEFEQHLDYIFYNPVKHGCVNSVKDWMYSSFHKFVKKNFYDINWGSSISDKVKDMNFE